VAGLIARGELRRKADPNRAAAKCQKDAGLRTAFKIPLIRDRSPR
jgi:hypothetical protein